MTDLTLNELKYLPKEKIKEILNMERKNIYGYMPDQLEIRSDRKSSFKRLTNSSRVFCRAVEFNFSCYISEILPCLYGFL